MDGTVSYSDVAAMCKGNECNGASWNSPMWLIWALLFGNGAFGGFGRNGQGLQDAEVMSQLNSIRQTMADNQNANALGAAIGGNHDFLHNLACQMNMGFAGTNATINAASTGNLLGQKDMQSAMQSCCCDIKSNLLNQTNQLQTAINGVQNSLINGFAQVGFLTQQQTNELNQNTNAGIQKILDKMCADTTQNLRDKLAEASQNAQTNYLISQLKTTA